MQIEVGSVIENASFHVACNILIRLEHKHKMLRSPKQFLHLMPLAHLVELKSIYNSTFKRMPSTS